MSERDGEQSDSPPENVAPDAVKDPNAKTGGKPGLGPKGDHSDGQSQGDESDPGSS